MGMSNRRTDNEIIKQSTSNPQTGCVLLGLWVFGVLQAQAQFPGGGGGGGGFGGGGNNANRSRSTTRQYPNNQVGNAIITVYPDSRNLIVVADDETAADIFPGDLESGSAETASADQSRLR